MQEKIREIASRVKELRDLCDYSVCFMAKELGMAEQEYEKFESGASDIPASVLCEIARIFKVSTTVLLTGEDARLHIFSVTRKDKGVCVERRKAYKYQAIAANFSDKKFEPFIVTVEPKESEQISTNTHPGHEFNYVLEGKLKVVIHQNEIELEAGDSIYFDSNYEHGMQAMDGRSAKFLAVVLR